MARKSPAEDLLVIVKDICFYLPLWAVPIVATAMGAGAHIVFTLLTKPLREMGVPLSPILYFLFVGGAFLLSMLAGFMGWMERHERKALVDRTNSIERLKELSWLQFEHLVAESYRKEGYNVTESGGSKPDGGIDIVATSPQGQRFLIQCKHWKSSKVGVKIVREMLGVLAKERASKVVIVATGTYTKEAIDFAEGQPIELVDGPRLLRRINPSEAAQHPLPPTSAPCQPATHTRTSELCPSCGSELVKRIAKRGPNKGNAFMGCSAFPGCRYTRNAS